MERYSIENFIVDENELAEHYKDKGNKRGYKGKLKLVEYLKELKAYKEAEEQGLLIKLPCKVGDSLWYIDNVNEPPLECSVHRIEITSNNIRFIVFPKIYTETLCFSYDELCKTWWLTKEEAEQALAEMKEV